MGHRMKSKLIEIASEGPSSWFKDATRRERNKNWRDYSFRIAVRILQEIRIQKDINGMSQKKLADEMGVSPQYINKMLKGQENLTLETIAKIEDILDISILRIPTTVESIRYDVDKVWDSVPKYDNIVKMPICCNDLTASCYTAITGTNA